ncbi:MAG: SdrD B-like domain-containing protein, partial [Dolichospermum sp.]
PIGSLGNYVWIDDNKNGLQDEPANKGLNGVKVYLYGPGADSTIGGGDDVLLDSTITANDFSGNPGFYLFPYLNSGKYYVQFPTTTLNNTYRLTPTNNQATQTDGNNDAATATGRSGLITIKEDGTGVNKDNMTIDAGYYPIGSLGNYVWLDNNRDGLQNEAASNGVNGVKVYLYNETAPSVYTLIDSTITANDGSGNSGYYNFIIYENGNYKVKFPTEVGARGLTTQTTTPQVNGNSDASIVDGFSPVIVMNLPLNGLHRNNPTIDAGYVPFGSLGNYVWFDENLDGLQNEPATNGLNGVPVYLWKETTPGNYTKIDSTITANDGSGNPGYYNFILKATGNYKVEFPSSFQNRPLTIQTATAGVNGNSDALVGNGFTNAIAMNLNGTGVQVNNPTIDAGYICNLYAGPNQVVCAGFGVTLTGTSPTTGTWVAHSGNATGATLSTTTGGIASANFASTTSGVYQFVYIDG